MEKTKKAFLVAPVTHTVCLRPGLLAPAGEPAAAGLTVQLPPFLQGPVLHSSTSVSQLAPVYPGRHEHV